MSPRSKTRRVAAVATASILAVTAFAGGLAYALGHVSAPATTAGASTPAKADYTCPMHPEVHADKPGDCPLCGMALVRVAAAAQAPAAAPAAIASYPPLPAGLQEVTLSHDQQVLANVATAVVARRATGASVSAAGQIAYDETRLSEVSARVDGRIERLFVNSTGAAITRGQPLASLYSPDLVASLQEYRTALASERAMRAGAFSDLASGARAMRQAAHQRLRLWGLSDAQIDRATHSRQASLALPLLAPASGVVTKKLVVAGQYVKTGDVLYAIADLSKVWVEANVFEAQLGAIAVGQAVEVTTAAYPGQRFSGRVAFIYPFLSPETRSIKVRAELANPSGQLKPDMFVSVQIHARPSRVNPLAIPASAVVDTGRHKLVFVEVAPGVFRPREVALGALADDFYAVRSGLAAGDRVATSGGFLLDANSQIQAGGAGEMGGMAMPPPASAGKTPAGAGSAGDRGKESGQMPGMAMPGKGTGAR